MLSELFCCLFSSLTDCFSKSENETEPFADGAAPADFGDSPLKLANGV
ncbi:hypothetical protein BCO26_1129 [Heyndrickxia coagulans 2-6]|nr:hypothetical protein BCO26_1129 [Heyndrickxia coagulans 2-6]